MRLEGGSAISLFIKSMGLRTSLPPHKPRQFAKLMFRNVVSAKQASAPQHTTYIASAACPLRNSSPAP